MKSLALMPFDKKFNNVFTAMKNACKNYPDALDDTVNEQYASIECVRVDQEPGLDVVKTLIETIKTATFCIVELTGNNKNVMWELGFAMALEKPVIIITSERESIGFDVRNLKNIQYEPNDTGETLEKPLIKAIKELVDEISDIPTFNTYAKSLAMSSGAATYFLDSSYKIRYMNEAAAALFSDSWVNGGAQDWIGSTLREFMSSFSRNLGNLPAIEKNLQQQKEDIFSLQIAKKEYQVCPYNIERIILNSDTYGKLELQKTGVAVRDPLTDSISGWVVSFNVVNVHNPQKFEKFHEKHRSLIEGMLLSQSITPNHKDKDKFSQVPSLAPMWPASDTIDEWVSSGCQSPQLSLAKDYAHKQKCFDFCISVLKNDHRRYGLESVRYLDEWFFDYNNAEYIIMETNNSQEFVGVFRIHMNTDLTKYDGLEEWVLQTEKDHSSFADVGAYLNPMIINKYRSKCLAIMLGHAARICEQNMQSFLYAQIPSYLLKNFESFLFRRGGKNFHCPGWKQRSWTPIALKATLYSDTEDITDWQDTNKRDDDFIKIACNEYQNLESLEKIF